MTMPVPPTKTLGAAPNVIVCALPLLVTVNVAAVVVALPEGLVNTARNFVPFWPAATFGTVKVVVVAPATFWKVAPPSVLNCHCTVGVGVPVAAAANVAVCPALTVWSVGFWVIEGDCARAEVAKSEPSASRKTAAESLTMFLPSALVKDKPSPAAPLPQVQQETGRHYPLP